MQLILSLAAIIALGAFAWALGFRASPVLDEAQARSEVQAVLPGFRATQAALAAEGRGAIVRGADGSLAIVWPLADGWIARRLAGEKPLSANGNRITVPLDEPMRKSIDLELAHPVPAWLAGRLA